MNQGMPMWPNNPNMNPNMGGWQILIKDLIVWKIK